MPSKMVTIADAKEALAELVEQALQGDEIILGEDEQPQGAWCRLKTSAAPQAFLPFFAPLRLCVRFSFPDQP